MVVVALRVMMCELVVDENMVAMTQVERKLLMRVLLLLYHKELIHYNGFHSHFFCLCSIHFIQQEPNFRY